MRKAAALLALGDRGGARGAARCAAALDPEDAALLRLQTLLQTELQTGLQTELQTELQAELQTELQAERLSLEAHALGLEKQLRRLGSDEASPAPLEAAAPAPAPARATPTVDGAADESSRQADSLMSALRVEFKKEAIAAVKLPS